MTAESLTLTIGGETFRSGKEFLGIAPARITELDARARRAADETVRCAIAAGEMLCAAKELLPHGAFLAWLASNCGSVTPRTAQKYMQLAEARKAELASGGAAGGPVIAERSLSQLYQDYGIVRHNPEHGGKREGAGRPAKDLQQEAMAFAQDPELADREASDYIGRLFDFAVTRSGWGCLETDALRSHVRELRDLLAKAEEMLEARTRRERFSAGSEE